MNMPKILINIRISRDPLRPMKTLPSIRPLPSWAKPFPVVALTTLLGLFRLAWHYLKAITKPIKCA